MRIAELYDVVADAYPSPVVEVNRAVAHGRADGLDAGLRILDAIADDPALVGTSLLGAVRGDLLAAKGDRAGAATAFGEAAAHSRNQAERRLLLRRAREVSSGDVEAGDAGAT